MYHYETNTILATPVPGLDSSSILEAYKTNIEYLKEKGYKPKLKVLDNQATKVIKAYLTPQQVSLQLVKLHNHHVNATERAIQTFKNHYIGALGTTDASQFNFGTNLPPKSKTLLIFYAAPASIQTALHTRLSKVYTTGIGTLLPHPAQKQAFTKTPICVPCEHPTALMPGSSAPQRITTIAIYVMSPKPMDTVSLVWPIYSLNTALLHPICTKHTYKSYQQNCKTR
jgi:hypothetical protein